MLPRCLPDASQMLLWCFPNASQMLPRCFPDPKIPDASQMLPRCLPDASLMSSRCFPDPRCSPDASHDIQVPPRWLLSFKLSQMASKRCSTKNSVWGLALVSFWKNPEKMINSPRQALLLYELFARELGWRFTARWHTKTIAKRARVGPRTQVLLTIGDMFEIRLLSTIWSGVQ